MRVFQNRFHQAVYFLLTSLLICSLYLNIRRDCSATKCDCSATKCDCSATKCNYSATKCDCRATKCDSSATKCECSATKCDCSSIKCDSSANKCDCGATKCYSSANKCDCDATKCDSRATKRDSIANKCDYSATKCDATRDCSATIRNHLAALALHRLLRVFNQTGDKWRHLPDVADWLNLPVNDVISEVLLILSLCWCTIRLLPTAPFQRRNFSIVLLTTITTGLIFCQKHSPASLVLPRLVYALLAVYTVAVNLREANLYLFQTQEAKQLLFRTLMLLCLVLHSSSDVICIGLLVCLLDLLGRRILTTSTTTNDDRYSALATVLMARVAFFYLGNSNGLATVNVGAGYTGVGAYWPTVVTLLMAVHTYTGPLLVYAHYAANNGYRPWADDSASGESAAVALAEAFFYVAAGQAALFSLLCTALRFHLFVWTVFSPKLLYMGMELVVTTIFLVIYAVLER